MRPDESIDALATTQHGVVARVQLLNAGLTPRMVDLRRESGRLVPLHAGMYLLRGHPLSLPARLTAACLAAGPNAVVSHRGAAAILGLDGVAPCVEISVPRGSDPNLEGVIVHRVAPLDRCDVARGALPHHTRVARTLVDLAAVVSPEVLGHALDDALSRQLVTCVYVRRRLDAIGYQGRKGVAALREALDERPDGRPKHQSEFERRLFALLEAAGLPRPESQYEVVLPGGRRAVLDFAYPQQLLAIEADSYRHHSSKRDWARDHVRNRELLALGWRVLPATWDDLARPEPLAAVVSRGLRAFPRPA